MTIGKRLRRLDQRAFGKPYAPKPEAERMAYLLQASNGLPGLGYAESVRPMLTELTREVVALRAEVEALKRTQ
jgi:hypothetical protein